MNYKITSDSTCDLSCEQAERYSIGILPLYVQLGDRTYQDGVDIFPDDIYQHITAGGALATTAAVNLSDYVRAFSALSRKYDFVIHICISQEFSCCYQNACLAAAEYENVYVVDSRNLSTGHGLVVLEAVRCAEEGMEPSRIVEHLHECTARVDASFILSRLDYMQKGGRCSTLAALGAHLLKLMPCSEVKDGKMGVGKKYRGKIDNCIAQYVRERLQGRDDLRRNRIFITHSGCAPEIVENVKAIIKECGGFDEVLETYAGCTVSSHCGPNTLGVLFVRK